MGLIQNGPVAIQKNKKIIKHRHQKQIHTVVHFTTLCIACTFICSSANKTLQSTIKPTNKKDRIY
jgi:hypothetical protein